MRRRKYLNILKILLHAAALLVVYLFQTTVFTQLPILGVKPLLLPVAVACVALHEGTVRGAAFGLFAGILCDAALNQPAVLFTILLTGGGLVIGYLTETVVARGFPSCVLCTAVLLVLCTAAQVVKLLVAGGGMQLAGVWSTALLQSLYSVLFVLPLYYMARMMNRAVRP